jgi:hypothetical protein
MNSRSVLLLSAIAAVVFAPAAYAQIGYSYYYSDPFSSINTAQWYQNGTLSTASGIGIYNGDAIGGALISKTAIPDGSSDYEVRATLAINANGGSYIVYLRERER